MKRAAKPTIAGDAFLRRAVRILEEVDAAKREATDARELLRGTLMLGVLPTIAPYLLPAVMAEFTEAFSRGRDCDSGRHDRAAAQARAGLRD